MELGLKNEDITTDDIVKDGEFSLSMQDSLRESAKLALEKW